MMVVWKKVRFYTASHCHTRVSSHQRIIRRRIITLTRTHHSLTSAAYLLSYVSGGVNINQLTCISYIWYIITVLWFFNTQVGVNMCIIWVFMHLLHAANEHSYVHRSVPIPKIIVRVLTSITSSLCGTAVLVSCNYLLLQSGESGNQRCGSV